MGTNEGYLRALRNDYKLSESNTKKIETFVDEVIGAPINLTAWSREEVWEKGILDSLALLGEIPGEDGGGQGIDIGSGAGIPGVVLAIADPRQQWFIVEARQRRGQFLQRIVESLELSNVSIVVDRAERWIGDDPEMRESFDWATIRAVADTRTSLELGMPFLKLGGRLLLVKGARGREDVAAEGELISLLGGSVRGFVQGRVMSPGGQWDQIAVVEKVAHCPERFPRRGSHLGRNI